MRVYAWAPPPLLQLSSFTWSVQRTHLTFSMTSNKTTNSSPHQKMTFARTFFFFVWLGHQWWTILLFIYLFFWLHRIEDRSFITSEIGWQPTLPSVSSHTETPFNSRLQYIQFIHPLWSFLAISSWSASLTWPLPTQHNHQPTLFTSLKR